MGPALQKSDEAGQDVIGGFYGKSFSCIRLEVLKDIAIALVESHERGEEQGRAAGNDITRGKEEEQRSTMPEIR